ncbi:hypothetical protein QE152_g23003 [Popillia japonica]|uniref:Uncharacterized protein n=1 Tax=Popillia japonica TaxID=7064 RepID=A0AAW1KK40_POPJA
MGRLAPRNEEGKPLCFVCKRYGQNQQNTASKRENAPVSSETLVTSSREEDKEGNLKYFKEALINGKPIQAYVDQGSKCVLLRRSETERLNLKYQPIQQIFIIRCYGSGEVKPLGKLEAFVEVDEAKAVAEMFVVPDQVQQIPLLIGQPFPEQRHVTIIRRRNTLRLFNEPMTNKDEEDGDDLKIRKPMHHHTGILPNDRYRVADLPETQRTQRFYEGIVPVGAMKNYVVETEDDASDTDDDVGSITQEYEPLFEIQEEKVGQLERDEDESPQ